MCECPHSVDDTSVPRRSVLLQLKHTEPLFSLFFHPFPSMRSRLRRYLNIPRVRCTCSPACTPFLPHLIPPPSPTACLPAFRSIQNRNTLSGVRRDRHRRGSPGQPRSSYVRFAPPSASVHAKTQNVQVTTLHVVNSQENEFTGHAKGFGFTPSGGAFH